MARAEIIGARRTGSGPLPLAVAHWRGAVVSGWLVVVMLIGGTSRADSAVTLVLHPLAVVMLAVGLATLDRETVGRYRVLFALTATAMGLAALQLLPLPPSVWSALPGRDIVVRIDAVVGLGEVWRPLSLTPHLTLSGLFAMAIPASLLVLAAPLARARQAALLAPFLIVVALGAVVAVMQLSQPGTWHFYPGWEQSPAPGLFANRNHQAALLAIAIPAAFVAARGWLPRANPMARWAPIFATLLAMSLILLSGSRSGLLLAAIALIATPFVIRARGFGRLSGGAAVAAMLALALLVQPETGLDRLIATDWSDTSRTRTLPVIAGIVGQYLPWGSGIGSFAPVYALHEPRELLGPTYLNRAHSDGFEWLLETGLFGAVLLLVALGAYARSLMKWSEMDSVARLGGLALAILLVASLTDYPLRIPAIGAVAMLAAIWLHGGTTRREEGHS